ncbi:HAMP domain-containing sensor histidine kinase [Deinococcus sp.]|uniref:sensor histidine kinase n=1 Tax=Deinococcus sp. TaxID=47478 RepID=UPI0025FD1F14|nr:HAMP domain-containing sensor histidine kinase [Deinococcus sp.]
MSTSRSLSLSRLSAARRPSIRFVSWLSAALSLGIIVLDALTPAELVIGTLLSAPVALSALGGSRRLTWSMVGLALAGNLLAGVINLSRDGYSAVALANRAVSMLAALLVGALTLRSQEASWRAARLSEEERRLARERSLRVLIEALSGPYGRAEFVRRAAQALRELSQAESVEIGMVRRAVMSEPHAVWPQGAGHLGQRLPLEYLSKPGSAQLLWGASGGDVWLARLGRPGDELLALLRSPQAAPELLSEAIQITGPLLERATLIDDLAAKQHQLAEQGERMRDLIYAFSHDLRTPLMANALNIQMALRGAYGPLPGEYLRTLENGLEANETLLSLADQLLLLAKYEGGEREELLSLDLEALTLSVLTQFGAQAGARDVTFRTELEPLHVCANRFDLRRAIQNLLENAVKFSPPGTTIELSLKSEDGQAVLMVADEGPGVPESRLPALFQRFRGGGAGAGSGLGLYLTRRIMEAHGGQVSYVRALPPLTPTPRSLFSLSLPLEGSP